MDATLPPLTSPFALDEATIAAFARDGHCVVRALASAEEASAYRPAIERATHDHAWDTRPLAKRDTYGKAFLQAGGLCRRDSVVDAFVKSPRFAEVASRLLGVAGVRLYHDQALLKEAGGGHTPWHQDQVYWPLGTDRTITMWMPLADVPDEVGTMTFADGTHLMGDLRGPAIGDDSERYFDELVAGRGLPTRTHGALRAGDATFHAGWTLHRAPANLTDRPRPVMTIIWFADGARIAAADDPYRAFDLAVWLGGRQPGELADSELNPVCWPVPQPPAGEG